MYITQLFINITFSWDALSYLETIGIVKWYIVICTEKVSGNKVGCENSYDYQLKVNTDTGFCHFPIFDITVA